VVRGYPDWSRRRETPVVTTIVAAQDVTVQPNSSVTLIDVQGKGSLTGLSVNAALWTSLANCWLRIAIDGRLYQLCFTGIAAPIVNSGAAYGAPATPFTVLGIDTAGRNAAVALTVPVRFSKSLKVEYRNEADSAAHRVDYVLSVDIEQ
jgi:hypothetical protein